MAVDFSSSHRAMDTRQHEQTYSSFIKLIIAFALLVIVTLVGMAAFLT